MKVAKKRVNIMLPVDVLAEIDSVADNRSKFILETVQKKLAEAKEAEFEKLMIEGYEYMNLLDDPDLKAFREIDLDME